MYPAQTSLIPAQIALARFLEQGGSIFGQYPYWYLGVPFRYLTGPILTPLLALLHRLLPGLNLFEIFFLIIALAWLVGGGGVYLLIRDMGGKREVGFLAALFYLFGPIVPFLFSSSNGLSLISFSVLPYVLLFYWRFLKGLQYKNEVRKDKIILIISISLLLLLDVSILPILFLGMAAVFLTQGWKKIEKKLKETFFILLFSVLISTIWYTPGYWLRVLSAPSLAGKGVFSVAALLAQLLPIALALTLAVLSVRFLKKKNLLRDFCFYWLFIFSFLTLIRFIADPDFVLDWSIYGVEIQMGLGVLLAWGATGLLSRLKSSQIYAKVAFSLIAFLVSSVWIMIGLVVFNRYTPRAFQKDITQVFEYKVGQELHRFAENNERVFLSGSTAFWLNAFFDIPQVRGGKDEVAPHPFWDENVWEVRDGTEPEKALKALRELGVSYLVVHTKNSKEFFHDFTYPEKFEEIGALEKVYERGGDRLYRVLD